MAFEDTKLGQYKKQAANPAAPGGARQAAQSAAEFITSGPQEQSGFAGSKLGKWIDETGYGSNARSWYGGQNREGISNGWNTDFMERTFAGQEEAAKRGTMANYFDQEDATGVVTWDHKSKDGVQQYRFGDVFENGKKVANLFDENNGGFDEYTASVMMGEFLFDAQTKAKLFADGSPARYVNEVKDARETRNREIPLQLQAAEFQGKVDKTEADFHKGIGNEAVIGGSALGTGALGAGIGSTILPGLGTAGGFLVGLGVGTVAGYLNQDQLTEQAARAWEITGAATRSQGTIPGLFEGVQQWAGFAGQTLTPTSNLVRGLYDYTAGDVGDGDSAYYNTNDEGEFTRPGWMKIADLGASVADGVIQFASPIGLTAYTAQMGSTIAGDVGGLVVTGGESFDPRRGGFDNIFTDEEGKFDATSAAAGVGRVGIDVIQLGMVRGLAQKADESMAAVGKTGAYEGVRAPRLSDRLPTWLGGWDDAGKAALKKGATPEQHAGMQFLKNEAGEVVSTKTTLALLAPSEQLPYLTARMMARRTAAVNQGATRLDDFYTAAVKMSTGEKKMQSTLVNAFGEGYEEAVQAVLEPLSHQGKLDGQEIADSFFYGAAAGGGMQLAFNFNTAGQGEKLRQQATMAGLEFSDDQWSKMSLADRSRAAGRGSLGHAAAEAAAKQVIDAQARTQTAGVHAVAKVEDAMQTELAKHLKSLQERTDGTFVIAPQEEAPRLDEDGNVLPGYVPIDAVSASALQTFRNLNNVQRGAIAQAKQLKADYDALLAGETPTDPEAEAARAETQAKLERNMQLAQQVVQASELIQARLAPRLDEMLRDDLTPAELAAEVDTTNLMLRDMFNQRYDADGVMTADEKLALSMAVSMPMGRYPMDQSGSLQLLVPQINRRLAQSKSDNVLLVHHAVMPPISGDYDGDKMAMLAQVMLDQDTFRSLRAGQHLLGQSTSVNMDAPKFEKYNIEALAESLTSQGSLKLVATETMTKIANAVRRRYGGEEYDIELDRVLQNFMDAVKVGDPKARNVLVDGLAQSYSLGGRITERGQRDLTNEWYWLDALIVSNLQEFQEAYVAGLPAIGSPNSEIAPAVAQAAPGLVRRRMANAFATLGQTLDAFAAGTSVFRSMQKLHYSSVNSPVVSAAHASDDVRLEQMALRYEELGQMITTKELDAVRAKDEITRKVVAQLNALAIKPEILHPSLADVKSPILLAAVQVDNYDVNPDGSLQWGNGTISLGQMLLKQALAADRRAKANTFDRDTDLQSRHAALGRIVRPSKGENTTGAGRAIAEIFSDYQVFTLLGDNHGALGPHQTVEQYLRAYTVQDETARRRTAAQLRQQDSNPNRSEQRNLPYKIDEVAEGELSPYGTLVDAILATGNTRIAIKKDGTVTGEIAERSARVSKDLRGAIEQAREALSTLYQGQFDRAAVARAMDADPAFARRMYDLIPNAAVRRAFAEDANGNLVMSPWLFDLLTFKDPREAEMHYWRNLLTLEWSAYGTGTPFNKLPRRMHRLLFNLQNADDGGYLWNMFFEKMNKATDLDTFLRWVNTTPELRGHEAPFVAWVDDTADFDADKANGGWTSNLAGAELREAISALNQTTSIMKADAINENRLVKSDRVVLDAVERWVAHLQDPRSEVRHGDEDTFKNLQAAVDRSSDLMVGVGPNAMVFQNTMAVMGFFGKGHTKGQNPEHLRTLGALEAQQDAFDYDVGYTRRMSSLTSESITSVANNLSELSKRSVQMTDDFGRDVVWEIPTDPVERTMQMVRLMKDPSTRQMARAILFPQVLELNMSGGVSKQLLIGKDLNSLLRGSTHQDLFRLDGGSGRANALKYMSLLEAQSRRYGGRNEVQRWVTDYVIARTSSANRTWTLRDIENEVVSAYQDLAKLVQDASEVAGKSTSSKDLLKQYMTGIRKAHRDLRAAQAAGITDEATYDDTIAARDLVLETLIQNREQAAADEIAELTLNDDGSNAAEIEAQANAIEADLKQVKDRIAALTSDDLARQILESFTVPEGPAVAEKQYLIDYVDTHPDVIQALPSISSVLVKMTNHRMDPSRNGQVKLSDKEWGEVSRGLAAYHMEKMVSRGANSLAVRPFPDDRPDEFRYLDPSFGYLLDPVMSAFTPIMRAAVDIRTRAGRMADSEVTDKSLLRDVMRSVFKEGKLGAYTSEIARASIAANERLASAAAEPAISMSGQSPATQDAFSAAQSRSFDVPDESYLTTARIPSAVLQLGTYDSVPLTFPGATGTELRPLIQLNNRFAKTAMLTFSDGSTMNLLLPANGGRVGSHEETANSPYRLIHVGRMNDAILAEARKRGVDPNTAVLELEFFHPESLPADPAFANNIFFEGTAFELDADIYDSLNATQWFSFSGESQLGQRYALDSQKTGESAIADAETFALEETRRLEAGWEGDFAAMLRRKTRAFMEGDFGFDRRLPAESYNMVFKDLKMRHYVVGENEGGETVILRAEEFMAMQRSGEPIPLTKLRLKKPSATVLRSLLGEQGGQGVTRDRLLNTDFDPSIDRRLRSTDGWLTRFPGLGELTPLGIESTRLVNSARMQTLSAHVEVSDSVKTAFEQKIMILDSKRSEIHSARAFLPRESEGGFSTTKAMEQARDRGREGIRTDRMSMDVTVAGVAWVGNRPETDSALSLMMLQDLSQVALQNNPAAMGWIYNEDQAGNRSQGLLSKSSLNEYNENPALHVAKGDLVVLELESFNNDFELASKRVEYFMERGAVIVLNGNGAGDLRSDLRGYLEGRMYETIAGAPHAFQMADPRFNWRNRGARVQSLIEMGPVTRRNRAAVFLVDGKYIQEGGAVVNDQNTNLGTAAVSVNLVPEAFFDYNVPIQQLTNESQIEHVRDRLLEFDTPEGREFIANMTLGEKLTGTAREEMQAEFLLAWDRLMDRLTLDTPAMLPRPGDEFGTGDLIPMINNQGELLLYRHGYKAPSNRDRVEEMQGRTGPNGQDAGGIAIYSSVREEGATSHTGTVVEFRQRGGYGLEVELEIDLQLFGNKMQLEWGGVKYTLMPKPDSLALPDHGFFREQGIDLVSDGDTARGKEGRFIDNFSDAFTVFGMDFLPDVTEFFFPGKGMDPESQNMAIDILRRVSYDTTQQISIEKADELLNGPRLARELSAMLRSLGDPVDPAGQWIDTLGGDTIESQITTAMLVYLLTPGARVEDVLRSGGFNHPRSTLESESQKMPQLFTQVFDAALIDSPLRTEMFNRINAQVYNPRGDGTGYVMLQNFRFQTRMPDASKNLEGWLAMPEIHSSGDNPVKNGMSFDEQGTQTFSRHTAITVAQAMSGRLVSQNFSKMDHDPSKFYDFAQDMSPEELAKDALDGGVWRRLKQSTQSDKAFIPWRLDTPAESERRGAARARMVAYRHRIEKTAETGWRTEDGRKGKNQVLEYEVEAKDLLRELGLDESQVDLVDYWVRQMSGKWYLQGETAGNVHATLALEKLREMRQNVDRGFLPLVGGDVALMDVHDLQMIFRAQKNRVGDEKWSPKLSGRKNADKASTWNQWVKISLGTVQQGENLFDSQFLSALDGFMHTYQNASRDLFDLPISLSTELSEQLLDPDLNDKLLLSMSPQLRDAMANPIVAGMSEANLREIIQGKEWTGNPGTRQQTGGERQKLSAARLRDRKAAKGIKTPVNATSTEFFRNGQQFVHYGTRANVAMRMMLNLRAGTAMINPMLWVSFIPEVMIKGGLDTIAQIASGQSTGRIGARQSAITDWLRDRDSMAEPVRDPETGEIVRERMTAFKVMERAGLVHTRTSDEQDQLRGLIQELAKDADFDGMIYQEMVYYFQNPEGMGKFEKATSAYARWGSKMQDPTYGVPPKMLARRYMEVVLEQLERMPTENVVPIGTLVYEMKTDSGYIKKNFPDAHVAATNAIANIRSLKMTMPAAFVQGIYEPMANSNNAAVNILGNLIKMPLMFSTYMGNTGINILGLQGFNDMAAMFTDGRKKGFVGKLQAAMRGEELDPDSPDLYDMSLLLEGLDLSRSFIRGGITHTALFTAGMMLGGLNLTGEDEEERYLRRQAELQGAGYIYDPRKPQNDFRNAQAVFFGSTPFQLPWIVKQFTSPLVGMERFFDTGDFRHVTWGFLDAVGSFPLFNASMINDALETGQQFLDMSNEVPEDGTPASLAQKANLLASAVGVYERMLFENSFINQLYVGFDPYDRDPYKQPLLNSDGTIQVDANGIPRGTDAMEQYRDPETGEVVEGYLGRTGMSSSLHQLTENRATMAGLFSLFTGGFGGSSFWRYNMAPKTRTVEKGPEIDQEVLAALVLNDFAELGGQVSLTPEEALNVLQNMKNTGQVDRYATNASLEPIAKEIAASSGVAGRDMLSAAGQLLAANDQPRVTDMGVYMTYETRQAIMVDWSKRLVQEGVDLGLDETKAKKRMQRIMQGDFDNPDAPSLADLLFSDQISYSQKLTYNQLNSPYVQGPGGSYWATGFKRNPFFGNVGGQIAPTSDSMTQDERSNSVDLIAGVNTGMRALEPERTAPPTPEEIGNAIIKAIEEAAGSDYTPFTPFAQNSGGGGGGGGRRFGGYGGRGGGGGGYANFQRMQVLPEQRSTYGSNIPYINTSNPILRRSDVRRERVWSERGRLKQWQ